MRPVHVWRYWELNSYNIGEKLRPGDYIYETSRLLKVLRVYGSNANVETVREW